MNDGNLYQVWVRDPRKTRKWHLQGAFDTSAEAIERRDWWIKRGRDSEVTAHAVLLR